MTQTPYLRLAWTLWIRFQNTCAGKERGLAFLETAEVQIKWAKSTEPLLSSNPGTVKQQTGIYPLPVLGTRSPKARVPQTHTLWSAGRMRPRLVLLLAASGTPWRVGASLLSSPACGSFCVSSPGMSVSAFPPLARTSVLTLPGPTLVTSSYLGYICKGPLPEEGHFLRCRGGGLPLVFLVPDTWWRTTGCRGKCLHADGALGLKSGGIIFGKRKLFPTFLPSSFVDSQGSDYLRLFTDDLKLSAILS